MQLRSQAFENGGAIETRYTVEGEDVSPPLTWEGIPAEAKSLALICDDPDAPSPRGPAAEPWVHWVIFNIPADVCELPAGLKRQLEPVEIPGVRQGVNSWPSDNVGYRGPAPPPGSGSHRHFFKLYALATMLDLEAGATKRQVLQAMKNHQVAECQLFGTYER